jgi:cellobiose-specific phosphotransferase system component IIA
MDNGLQEAHNRELATIQEKLDAARADLLSARKRHEDDLRQRSNRIEV